MDAVLQLRGLWIAQDLGEGACEKSGGLARDAKDSRYRPFDAVHTKLLGPPQGAVKGRAK